MEGGDEPPEEVEASVRRAANFGSIVTTLKETETSWKTNGTWRPDIFPKVQRNGRFTTLGKQFDLSWKLDESPVIGNVYDRREPKTPKSGRSSYRPRSNRGDGDSDRPSAQRPAFGGFFSRRKGKAADARSADSSGYTAAERQRLQGATLLSQPEPRTLEETENQATPARLAPSSVPELDMMLRDCNGTAVQRTAHCIGAPPYLLLFPRQLAHSLHSTDCCRRALPPGSCARRARLAPSSRAPPRCSRCTRWRCCRSCGEKRRRSCGR